MTKNSKRAAVSAGCAMLLAMSAGTGWAQEATTDGTIEVEATVADAEIGGWRFEEIDSPLEGTRTLAAVLTSSTEVANIGGAPEPVELFIRCQNGSLAAFMGWPLYLGYNRGRLAYRFDDGELRTETWQTSTAGTAIGRFDNRQGRALIEQIGRSRQLAVRVLPRYFDPRETVFDLTGSAEVTARILAACS